MNDLASSGHYFWQSFPMLFLIGLLCFLVGRFIGRNLWYRHREHAEAVSHENRRIREEIAELKNECLELEKSEAVR